MVYPYVEFNKTTGKLDTVKYNLAILAGTTIKVLENLKLDTMSLILNHPMSFYEKIKASDDPRLANHVDASFLMQPVLKRPRC